MSDTLTPNLKPLDERVLAVLPARGREKGLRAARVAAVIFGDGWLECVRCGATESAQLRSRVRWEALEPVGCLACMRVEVYPWHDQMRRFLRASPEDVQTVREILRGLERVGKAYQAGGWWRRV